MNQQSNAQSSLGRSLAFSYLHLRRGIGFIGFFLPFVLALGTFFVERLGIQHSISDYYHRPVMGNVFVGSLCAIGLFLVFYRYPRLKDGVVKNEKWDTIAAVVAGISAIGVALFNIPPPNPTAADRVVGAFHGPFAAVLFVTFALMSIFLFTKTDKEKRPSKGLGHLSLLFVTKADLDYPKRLRNLMYRICGYTILVCLVLWGIVEGTPLGDHLEDLKPVFWLESLMVVAFGLAWLVKGEVGLGRLRRLRLWKQKSK